MFISSISKFTYGPNHFSFVSYSLNPRLSGILVLGLDLEFTCLCIKKYIVTISILQRQDNDKIISDVNTSRVRRFISINKYKFETIVLEVFNTFTQTM